MSPWVHIILSAILLVVGTIWQGYGWFNLNRSNETSKGNISGKILNINLPYILNFGNNFTIFNGKILENGIDLAKLSKVVEVRGIKIPVRLYEEKGRLLVDVSLYNKDQRIIAQIVRNEWEVYPNGKYDKNSAVNAFEIVDKDHIPVFQVYLQPDNQIYFGGYFYQNITGLIFYYTPEGISNNKPLNNKTLFKYPSSKHQGEFEQSNLPSFQYNRPKSRL